MLTEEGVAHAEKLLGVDNLYDPQYMEVLHHLNQALKAHALFKKDVDYIVKQGQVIIVDEFTGRLMPGRRYSDGLHQALEAKENVKIENENQTLATVTFQNFFRMYSKLAGMTGTADTEAPEFAKNLQSGRGGCSDPSAHGQKGSSRSGVPDRKGKERRRLSMRSRNCTRLAGPVLVGHHIH